MDFRRRMTTTTTTPTITVSRAMTAGNAQRVGRAITAPVRMSKGASSLLSECAASVSASPSITQSI
jgi:hypothetical protein